jgi:hypothetical protein
MSYSKKIHYQRLLEVEDDDGWIVHEDGQHDSPHHHQDEEQQLVMIIDVNTITKHSSYMCVCVCVIAKGSQ